ncbi:MAG: hypothetical protein GY946_16180, partial [bacterium]|nr:hypothetical protein [bacterium]
MIANDRGRDATPKLIWRFTRYGLEEKLREVRHRLGRLRLRDLGEHTDRVPASPLAQPPFDLAAGL